MTLLPGSLKYRIALAIAFLSLAALLTSQPAPREQVGPLPGGAFLLNSGWRLDPVGRQIALDTLPMSTALSPDGKYLLVLNGGYRPPTVSVIETSSGRVTGSVPVADGWLGLAISPKGDMVYVGGGSKASLFEFAFAGGVLPPARTFVVVPLAQRGPQDFIGDVAFSPDGRLLYAANLYRDSILVVNPQSGMVTGAFKTGRRPHRILGQYDTAGGSLMGQAVRVGAHASDMLWRDGSADPTVGTASGDVPPYTARIFVAAANTNHVFALGVTAAKDVNIVESINLAMTPRQPVGMSPSALGLSADGKRLFVACSDANAAAVVDIAEGRSRVEGVIPTGWYPTAVRALATGTLANSPCRDEKLDQPSPLPKIEHVIYIVKQNRTYDQVLGDMKEGNGASSLVLFGENSTPNLHKLAREFVLLDNFYVNSDVSADGHNWSTAAIAPDYVQKMWPNKYASRRATYDFEEQDPTSLPPAGYLWTNAAAAGLSQRNFGYMVNNKANAAPGAEQITGVRDPVLAKVTNPLYRGFDLNYPDLDRTKVFLSELAEYEKTGNMPRLIVMRLGNDHTSGTAAGKIAPLSAAADNDYAVGQLVEGVSKSRFWTSTAIFILEDDAQNGPDHVDSHRSPAFVISPWVKHHAVDSSMYNTTSMLRTMEFLLGLKPMTHFDAGARPMTAAFQSQPNPAPYTAEKPRISLEEKNPAGVPSGPAAAGVPFGPAARMNFEEADENDDNELNDILWRAIRKDAPPPPMRSIFGR